MNPNFRGIAISKEAFDWLQLEKKRTRLSIKVIVDNALSCLSATDKKSPKMRLK